MLTNRLSNVKAVVFEGPDCCGKSTQVDGFIHESLKYQENEVIIKIHFPFNINGDDKLKQNYNNLINTIYSENFFKDDPSYENAMNRNVKLYDVLKDNIMFNSEDKQTFIYVLSKLLTGEAVDIYTKYMNGKLGGASIKELLTNPNCEIWFNGNSIDTSSDEELKMVLNYFKSVEYPPKVLLVFDRFIMSGIIYNYLLPKKVFETYHSKGIIGDETYNNLKNSLFDVMEVFQREQTTYELDAFNELLRTPVFSFSQLDYDDVSNYCDPKVLWFVFKESKIIYQAFLNDKERKSEAYDTNDILRESVNEIFEDIIMYGNKSKNLLDNKFNMLTVDSDESIKTFKEQSKEIISLRLNNVFEYIVKKYKEIELQINSFLTEIKYK